MIETYEVTQEQYDKIMAISESRYPLLTLVNEHNQYVKFIESLTTDVELALARYMGGDERIVFVVKEQSFTWSIFGNGVRYAIARFDGGYAILDKAKSSPAKLTKSEVIDLGFNPDIFTNN